MSNDDGSALGARIDKLKSQLPIWLGWPPALDSDFRFLPFILAHDTEIIPEV